MPSSMVSTPVDSHVEKFQPRARRRRLSPSKSSANQASERAEVLIEGLLKYTVPSAVFSAPSRQTPLAGSSKESTALAPSAA